jgi:hypothetical protein
VTNELGRAETATVLSAAMLVFMARNGSPISSWVMARKVERTGRRPRSRHARGRPRHPHARSRKLCGPRNGGRSARPLQSGLLASSPSCSASSGHRRPAPSGAPLPQLARSLRPTTAVACRSTHPFGQVVRSSGMAAISLVFSGMLSCPRTSRALVACRSLGSIFCHTPPPT